MRATPLSFPRINTDNFHFQGCLFVRNKTDDKADRTKPDQRVAPFYLKVPRIPFYSFVLFRAAALSAAKGTVEAALSLEINNTVIPGSFSFLYIKTTIQGDELKELI
ncbi:hypothetical protein KKE54_06040 [bacterium]|nr:hypothetical protein [bacterium]